MNEHVSIEPAIHAVITGTLGERLIEIGELETSLRADSLLKKMGVQYAQELFYMTDKDLRNVKGIGQITVNELHEVIEDLGGHLGIYADSLPTHEQRMSRAVRQEAMKKDFMFSIPASAPADTDAPEKPKFHIEIPAAAKGNIQAMLSPMNRLTVRDGQKLMREGITTLGALALMTRKEVAKMLKCDLDHVSIHQIEDRLIAANLKLSSEQTAWQSLYGRDGKIDEQKIIELYELNTFKLERYASIAIPSEYEGNANVLLPIKDIEWPAEHASQIAKSTEGKFFLGELLFVEDGYHGYSQDKWGRNPKHKRDARKALEPYGLDIEVIDTKGQTPAFLTQDERRQFLATVFKVDPAAKPVAKATKAVTDQIATDAQWVEDQLPRHLRSVFTASTLAPLAKSPELAAMAAQFSADLSLTLTMRLLNLEEPHLSLTGHTEPPPRWLNKEWLTAHLPPSIVTVLREDYLNSATQQSTVIRLALDFKQAQATFITNALREKVKELSGQGPETALPLPDPARTI